jgi:hypothetical protein
MRTWKRPPTLALAMSALVLLAIVLLFTRGIGEVLVLAVSSLLVIPRASLCVHPSGWPVSASR